MLEIARLHPLLVSNPTALGLLMKRCQARGHPRQNRITIKIHEWRLDPRITAAELLIKTPTSWAAPPLPDIKIWACADSSNFGSATATPVTFWRQKLTYRFDLASELGNRRGRSYYVDVLENGCPRRWQARVWLGFASRCAYHRRAQNPQGHQ